uniref:phenol hydroxylase subunit n=1 Tax=Salmonella enterica TaxID=28901 RepID=UPI003F4E6928
MESCYRPISWPMFRRSDGNTSISPENIAGQSLSVGFRPSRKRPHPELAVEMIMPVKAFEEFCAHHQVQHLSTDDFAKIEYDRMKWRFGQAGIRE